MALFRLTAFFNTYSSATLTPHTNSLTTVVAQCNFQTLSGISADQATCHKCDFWNLDCLLS